MIPKRYQGVSLRPPAGRRTCRPDVVREVRRYVDALGRERLADGPGDLVHRRRRDRQDDARDADLRRGAEAGALGRDLLAAAAARRCCARRSTTSPRPRSATLLDRLCARRPAARRRRRRRADAPVGARAALHDRQHALRGRRARWCSPRTWTDAPGSCAEQIGERTVSRIYRDVRRPAAAVRRPTSACEASSSCRGVPGPPTTATLVRVRRSRGRASRALLDCTHGHGRHRDRGRPVGRRGQGQGHRPARRARRTW